MQLTKPRRSAHLEHTRLMHCTLLPRCETVASNLKPENDSFTDGYCPSSEPDEVWITLRTTLLRGLLFSNLRRREAPRRDNLPNAPTSKRSRPCASSQTRVIVDDTRLEDPALERKIPALFLTGDPPRRPPRMTRQLPCEPWEGERLRIRQRWMRCCLTDDHTTL